MAFRKFPSQKNRRTAAPAPLHRDDSDDDNVEGGTSGDEDKGRVVGGGGDGDDDDEDKDEEEEVERKSEAGTTAREVTDARTAAMDDEARSRAMVGTSYRRQAR